MNVSSNVKGAVSFLTVILVTVVYDAVGDFTHPAWDAKVPMWFMNAMPWIMFIVLPIVFLVAAFSATYSLQGDRRGYVGLMVVGVIIVVPNILPSIWRFQAHQGYGAAICIFEMLFGIIMMRYAYAAFREPLEPAQSAASKVPTAV